MMARPSNPSDSTISSALNETISNGISVSDIGLPSDGHSINVDVGNWPENCFYGKYSWSTRVKGKYSPCLSHQFWLES